MTQTPILLPDVLSALSRPPIIHFSLPIYYDQSKSTTVLVNMNRYTKWHYHQRAQAKLHYHSLVHEAVPPPTETLTSFLTIFYIYYRNAASDPGNIAEVMEKFALDALKLSGHITDDNAKLHSASLWLVPCQDKANPRCEVSLIKL